MVYFLAPIAVEILFGLPSSVNRWEMQKDCNAKPLARQNIKSIRKERGNVSGLSALVACNEIECSTFFWQRVAKLSSGLFPPAFVITNMMLMNAAK
jgi:hypothetical protein